ncbi:hypothetical protein FRC17_002800 [Serendipita sp. 399]|nr:hypothetical protein FRC17_002800 [Serendipita sp. 399]
MITAQQVPIKMTSMGGESGIKEFIATREREVRSYETNISKEKETLVQSERAIENLEKALTVTKRALEFQKQNLEALKVVNSRIKSSEIVLDSHPSDEKSSSELYEWVKTSIAEQTNGGTMAANSLLPFAEGLAVWANLIPQSEKLVH